MAHLRNEDSSSAASGPGGLTRAALAPQDASVPPTTTGTGGAPGRVAPQQERFDDGAADEGEYMPAPKVTQRNRPGLGTEFGESRYSAASFTRFVRANNRPIAIAELRYNDFAGLVALGIHAQPLPDEAEILSVLHQLFRQHQR